SRIFRRVYNLLIGSNRDARRAASTSLTRAGFRTRIFSSEMSREARRVGEDLTRSFLLTVESERRKGPYAAVGGGETTVTVHGSGRGGRNQEFALSAARVLARKGLRC